MDIRRVCVSCFSPCGNTKKAAMAMAVEVAGLLKVPCVEMDFTLPGDREREQGFSCDDLVIIATPVYAGRVPNKIMPYIRDGIKGDNNPCICMVSFGNRAYDDALYELTKLMKDNGMKVIGAAAICSEHSFAPMLAAGHPNERDEADIKKFAWECVDAINNNKAGILNVPGDRSLSAYYKPLKADNTQAVFLKAVPVTDAGMCNGCGICATVCPMGSVSRDNPLLTEGVCIKCQACIKSCPQKARYFSNEDFLSHIRNLEDNQRELKKSEYYIIGE